MCETMKKSMFIVLAAMCLAGCQKASMNAESIRLSNPIMPIRMSGDTMHIVLTDYVPALYGDTSLWKGMKWTAGEAVECVNLVGTPQVVREMDIINRDRAIHALTMHDKSGSFAIPILPNKPVKQALYSKGYADGKLIVDFAEKVANPSFEAYIQNTLIDHHLWQETEEGSWSLDISNFKILI